MKPQSAKAKGRTLQQWTRDLLLKLASDLEPDDIRSTSMGNGGEDVQLSPAAREVYPFKIECKSKRDLAVHTMYEQACAHEGNHIPVLVCKKDRKNPLAVMDAEWFFQMWVEYTRLSKDYAKWKDFY